MLDLRMRLFAIENVPRSIREWAPLESRIGYGPKPGRGKNIMLFWNSDPAYDRCARSENLTKIYHRYLTKIPNLGILFFLVAYLMIIFALMWQH